MAADLLQCPTPFLLGLDSETAGGLELPRDAIQVQCSKRVLSATWQRSRGGGARHELFTLEEADECILGVWNEAKISSRLDSHVVFLSIAEKQIAEKQTTRVLPVSVEASNLSRPSVHSLRYFVFAFSCF